MSLALPKAPRLKLPRRSLVRPHRDIWHYDVGKTDVRTYERGRAPSNRARVFSFPRALRAAYHAAGSVPIGLHYSGPRAAGFTREVFTIAGDPGPNAWLVPVGFTTIDVLLVGGGGTGQWAFEFNGVFFVAGSGGGGGGIVVQNGLVVTPGDSLRFVVATAGGGSSRVKNDTLGGITIAGPAGGGGRGPIDSANGAVAGGPTGGSGAGGSFDFVIFGAGGNYAPSVGDGASGAGGVGAGVMFGAGGTGTEGAGGGGGGASGANGSAAVAGLIGGQGTPGNGGDGAVPADSSFGPWGTDIGENGVFGGGGWGSSSGNLAGDGWTLGTPGLGNGADNTGGGGGPNPAPDPVYTVQPGRSGIVVIIYATP